MAKSKCCICFRRSDRFRTKLRSIQQPHFLEQLKEFAVSNKITFKNNSLVCAKCYLKVKHCSRQKQDGLWTFKKIDNQNAVPEVANNDGNMDVETDTGAVNEQLNLSFHSDAPDAMEIDHDAVSDAEMNVEQASNASSPLNAVDITEIDRDADLSEASVQSDVEEISDEEDPPIEINPPSTSHQEESVSSHSQLPNIKSVHSSQKRCFICKSTAGRKRIPKIAIKQIWERKRVCIPLNNRCCGHHLTGNKFNENALSLIEEDKIGIKMSNQEIAEWFLQVSGKEISKERKKKLRFDFSCESDIPDDDYVTLLGINKINFENLYTYVASSLHSSSNRHPKNALAMFLVFLRLNVSQSVLGIMFGIANQSTVSDTLAAVTEVLYKNFVPKFLGFSHISRNVALKEHARRIFNIIFKAPEDELFLIMDGTYLYIDKPADFVLQKRTWSTQKNRNLVKPFMIAFPSGYVVDAPGPFYADGKNNDASILNFLLKPQSELRSYVKTGKDHFVVDRGFRDSLPTLEDLEIKMHMPNFLGEGETQFTTSDGNESRKVTLLRWLIEAVNGRLKMKFKFFADVIPGSYLPKLTKLFRITMAIINAYCPSLMEDTDRNLNFAMKALDRGEQQNTLKAELASKQLDLGITNIWKKVNHQIITGFPKLNLEELEQLTLGPYQIGLAKEYIKQYQRNSSEFSIYINKKNSNILRAKIESRFASRKTHNVWIKYNDLQNGIDSILGYYCQCKQGARTVGCCSHITSVIWYLSYFRHNEELVIIKPPRELSLLDAGNKT